MVRGRKHVQFVAPRNRRHLAVQLAINEGLLGHYRLMIIGRTLPAFCRSTILGFKTVVSDSPPRAFPLRGKRPRIPDRSRGQEMPTNALATFRFAEDARAAPQMRTKPPHPLHLLLLESGSRSAALSTLTQPPSAHPATSQDVLVLPESFSSPSGGPQPLSEQKGRR